MSKLIKGRPKKEWLEKHYQIEHEYAQKILKSKKDSPERSQLFAQGYDAVTKIMKAYTTEGGETDYTAVVMEIINKRIKPDAKIFDLGCATGNLVRALIKKGYQAKGIDVSADLIAQAKEKLKLYEAENKVEKADIFHYQTEEKFDALVMDNVIEHFHPDSIDDLLKKCFSMLKPKGYLIIMTPHRFSGPHDVSKHFVPLGDAAKGFHLIEFSFTELYQRLQKVGFNDVYGFPFHPRLFKKINFVPTYSPVSAQMNMLSEKILSVIPFSFVLKFNANLSRLVVALMCPAVCVAQKDA